MIRLETVPGQDDVTALRRTIRDLAALAALPAIWFSSDLAGSLQNLAEVLAAAVRARFVFVRVTPAPGEIVDAASHPTMRAGGGQVEEVRRHLALHLDLSASEFPSTIPAPEGRALLRVCYSHVAMEGQVRGVIIACSAEEVAGGDHDRLLLHTGAAQVAILLQRHEIEAKRQAEMRERARVAADNAGLYTALQRELVRAQQGEEANRRLALIVQSSDDAIVAKDLNGVITSWNPGAARIFGYTADEIVGRSINLLIPPDRQHEEGSILSRIRRGERVDHYETIRRAKDGRLVDVSLTVSPLRTATGEIVGASKIARDITEKRRAESQQQALYELVETVNRAAALPEIYAAALGAIRHCHRADRGAILLYDASGVMRFVASRGLSDGYRQAVEGHSPWKRDDPEPKPVCVDDVAAVDLEPSLRAVIEREGIKSLAFIPLTYEKRLLGKFMVYFDTVHAFTAVELRPIETIASQVAFAIERRKSAAELELLVAERTASLRTAIEQMEEFSYSVSHDLRSPVRSMRGYAEVILDDYGARLDDQGRELLARIQRNGARMDRLIRDLLTYSRLARREMKLEVVSLDRLVREVIQHYPELMPEAATIEIAEPLPEVLAHEPSLTQVISNLLSNAVKFVALDQRPHVRVSWEPTPTGIRLSFTDNGIGIKPEYQARLFGLFERMHPDQNYDGTGIGLAIVRKAMERMNGAAGVVSDGTSGSRFWIELPTPAKA